ncbi:protein TMED8 [Microcaecilia unicolor]|uniref:Protein TMED8 n=1 Tax=Microcaecilia unicolor TaxID=1415580 RepID=A0A6P7YUS3_9AMPH|nr:protein TMED8 [Microcaecilia unicolor]
MSQALAAGGSRSEPAGGGSGDGAEVPGVAENENARSSLTLPDPPQLVSDRLQPPSPVDSAEDSGKGDDMVGNQRSPEKEEVQLDQTISKESARLRRYQHSARKVPGDILMMQSDHTGKVDIVQEVLPLSEDEMTAAPPPLAPASTWTSPKIKEFKVKMAEEKNAQMVVKRGEVVTVRVPTHPDGKRICWEFATDDYDIGFGLYFDWVPVTSTAITIHASDSSDEEEEDEDGIETHWHVPVGDVERGSKNRLRIRYGEIMPVFRRDSHREVQAGSHDYPGEGIYLLKLDNSYSLLRNKTLYFHVYYTS